MKKNILAGFSLVMAIALLYLFFFLFLEIDAWWIGPTVIFIGFLFFLFLRISYLLLVDFWDSIF